MIAMLAFSALPTAAQDIAHLGTNQLVLRRSMTWRFRTQRERASSTIGAGTGIITVASLVPLQRPGSECVLHGRDQGRFAVRTLPTRLP